MDKCDRLQSIKDLPKIIGEMSPYFWGLNKAKFTKIKSKSL